MRAGCHRFNERLVTFMSDDRCAFCDRRADSAGMIEVMVRVDDVLDWLVGSQFLGLGDDGRRTDFVLWSFDQDKMIGKLGHDAVMTLAGEIPQSLPNFFNCDHCRCRCRWRLS